MDRVCITMPDSLREFLIAIPVIQDYEVQLVVGAQKKQRESLFEVTFRLDEQFQPFEPCLKVCKENDPLFDYSGWRERQRGDYDCFIDFDFDNARKMSLITKEHITESFGNLLGAGPKKWPALAPLQLKAPETMLDVLIIPWSPDAELFYDFLQNNHPELLSVYDDRDITVFEEDPVQFIDYINHFRIVVAPVGAAAYVAATLQKSLIEVFPTEDERVLFDNTGAPVYGAIVGSPSAELMWAAWEGLWENLQEHIRVTPKGEIIPTVQ